MSLRKEMFIAIFLGLFFGGLVALVFAEIPQRLLGKANDQSTESLTPTPTIYVPAETSLSILVPEDQAFVTEDQITISGKTMPNTTVVITGNADETIAVSDTDGAFSANLQLALGANEIVAYINTDEQTKEDMIVVNYTDVDNNNEAE